MDEFVEGRELAVVEAWPTEEFPDTLDGIQLGAVRRQVVQRHAVAKGMQTRLQIFSFVIGGIVQNNAHATATIAMRIEVAQECLKSFGIERGDHQRKGDRGSIVEISGSGDRHAP